MTDELYPLLVALMLSPTSGQRLFSVVGVHELHELDVDVASDVNDHGREPQEDLHVSLSFPLFVQAVADQDAENVHDVHHKLDFVLLETFLDGFISLRLAVNLFNCVVTDVTRKHSHGRVVCN